MYLIKKICIQDSDMEVHLHLHMSREYFITDVFWVNEKLDVRENQKLLFGYKKNLVTTCQSDGI